jgi:hypothetical protein
MTWRLDQITAHGLTDDETDDPVVTVTFDTPAGSVKVMGEAHEPDPVTLCLQRVHIEGPGANAIGIANLRVLAAFVMEGMGYEAIEIEGALRTTGATPGHRPRPLRFTRRIRPAAER